MTGSLQPRLRTQDGDRLQDARPSTATECGVKGDQAGLQQTDTATTYASKQQDSTMYRRHSRPVRTCVTTSKFSPSAETL